MLSTCCFLTGQVPSHKLFGRPSKYVGTVPLSPSVRGPEDHQVNVSLERDPAFCFLTDPLKRGSRWSLLKVICKEYQVFLLNFYHLISLKRPSSYLFSSQTFQSKLIVF